MFALLPAATVAFQINMVYTSRLSSHMVETTNSNNPVAMAREDDVSFLDIPGEVQNEIYLVVLEGTGACLTKNFRIAMSTNLSLEA